MAAEREEIGSDLHFPAAGRGVQVAGGGGKQHLGGLLNRGARIGLRPVCPRVPLSRVLQEGNLALLQFRNNLLKETSSRARTSNHPSWLSLSKDSPAQSKIHASQKKETYHAHRRDTHIGPE